AAFEIALPLGTLLSIVLVFRRDLWAMTKVVPVLFLPSQWKSRFAADDAFRTGVFILISMVPAGILGILLKERIEALFDRPAVVGVCLIVTGLLLFGLRCAPVGRKPIEARSALLMGFAQACALLPGISRSGSTITAGLWSRCDRAAVGRFAFLMAIPPIAGAALLEFRGGHMQKVDAMPLALGLLAAFVSGTLALVLLLRFVRGGQLHWFSPYCILLGLTAVFFS
ncbi:MAG TPA: undecaprenyl-diphosphate phosphatase, partial [Planctomycetota bacterium]|nr:undecaprenyl-diphosphate phosphatase [Planctomycetota bacterium]